MEYTTLSNGVKMPMLGFGVYQIDANETERCVLDAIRAGYRSIDTAQVYFNEEGVGEAVKKSGVAREELFITSKVWLEHYGYDACRSSVLASLSKLKFDYVDLMLLHPSEGAYFLRARGDLPFGRGETFPSSVGRPSLRA